MHDAVHRRAHRPAFIQDIVDQNHDSVLHRHAQYRRLNLAAFNVVAPRRDIEAVAGNIAFLKLIDHLFQTLRQKFAAGLDADQHQSFHTLVFFYDFMRHAH